MTDCKFCGTARPESDGICTDCDLMSGVFIDDLDFLKHCRRIVRRCRKQRKKPEPDTRQMEMFKP